MKTMKFRLLATIITLAAVTIAANSNAQRRSTSDNNSNSRKVENTRNANKSTIERKSASRDNVKESQVNSRSVRSNSEFRRSTPTAAKEMKKEVSRTANYIRENQNNRSNRQVYSAKSGQTRNENKTRSEARTDYNTKENKGNTGKVIVRTEAPRRSSGYSTEKSRNYERSNVNSNRNGRANEKSERYNHNTNDVRYKPTREYKGSDKYWSSDYRTGSRKDKHSTGKYNYNKHNHWDRNWESYRWNHNSWRNYYGYYSPYSYRNHKYYYHHNYYGHVIRKFVYRPQIYIHNHTRYYCYDGNFFRYRRGIGYVLVDIPFGMSFEYLPNDFEQVNINGFLYFRIGNLFFERTNYGFQLVHYPERYFAYDDGYRNEGFRFNDIMY